MSDHVDGPRSIGDPPADLTDLFAFTSPENPAHTVLAACVFPSAGEDAIFSNIIDYSIAVRRVTVAGVGNAAKFQPADDEIRVFAGLRSDAFYLAWIVAELKKVPNLLQHTNVLCMVVELDTRRVLDPTKGSLFGAIAETVPVPLPPGLLGPPARRIDWVARPEQTNIR